MGRAGFELSALTNPKNQFFKIGGAKCGALQNLSKQYVQEVAHIIQSWPLLQASVRQKILGIIQEDLQRDIEDGAVTQD